MAGRDDYFARVRPLIGTGLSGRSVGVTGVSLSARILDLLAACMLSEAVVRDPGEPARWPLTAPSCRGPHGGADTALDTLRRYFEWKNEWEPLRLRTSGTADVELVSEWLAPGEAAQVEWEPGVGRVRMRVPPGDLLAWEDASWAVAREIRELLLGRADPLPGTRYLGTAGWPFALSGSPARLPGLGGVPRPPRGHAMIVGCGSVGSEAARLLAGAFARWTLVDGGRVTAFNPSRQWFGTGDLGRSKVAVLAERLGASTRCVGQELRREGLEGFERTLCADRPDVVLLATGTSADADVTRLLWRLGIPHVVAYAYPRARYFEVTSVVPAEATACLHCFRGHLFRGREAAPELPDEVASFVYASPDPAERDRRYIDLVAEPATRIETFRIALVAAACCLQVAAERERRSAWFRRMLDEDTPCLLGGNAVEGSPGARAYGIDYPGQVLRLGLPDVAGPEERRACDACGRVMPVAHCARLPAPEDADVDRALLG